MRPFHVYIFVIVIYKGKLDMSKRKTSMDIDDVMNHINAWLGEESDDEAEDDLHEVVGDENEEIDPSEKNMLEDEINLEVESSSSQNRYIFRKQLTKKRLVHNIDCSLNEDNFEPIVYANGKAQFEKFTGYLGPKNPQNTKTLSWGSEFPSGRQRGYDTVYQPRSCLLTNTKTINAENFDDLFYLFFDQIMNIIVYHANSKIKDTISHLKKNPKFVENLSKYPQVKETDIIKINALFGFMYLRGLLGMSLQRVDYLFSDYKGHFAFGAIMSKNRFKFLLSHITFDDYSDWEKNWPKDCFAAIRPVWELFNKNLGKYIAPSEYLTIDETLYPMRHQIAFRQYDPNKPHKYGVLFKSLNEARFPYIFKSVPYAAKPTINSTINHVKYLVSQTKMQVNLHGKNISTDRLYTSIEHANWLLDQNITTVGTVQKGRQGIPDKLLDTTNREIFSKTCHFEKDKKDLCLTSYTVKTKSKGKKNVVILSTTRPLHCCAKDDQKSKPQIFKFFDFTKGGTDIVDQMNDYFTTRAVIEMGYDCLILHARLNTSQCKKYLVYKRV